MRSPRPPRRSSRRPRVAAALRRRPLRLGASSSSHSLAPSSRVHCAAGLGRRAPRRRSFSAESSQARSSSPRWLTWCAPRRATLPHPAALEGSDGRSSRGARSVRGLSSRAPLPRSSAGRRRGAPPVRGGPERPAADLGAPDLGAPRAGRACPGAVGAGARPCAWARAEPAERGRPVWPALLPAGLVGRDEAAPPLRPVPEPVPPVRDPVAERVPPGLAGRRVPPPPVPADGLRRAAPPALLPPLLLPPVPLLRGALPLRDDGRPVPLRLPCPPPPGRAGRPDPPDRAEEARRLGWEEFWGIR